MVYNYKKNNNQLLKEQALEYLGGKICAICGNRALPVCCYDFHHKNGNKEENISQMIQRKSKLDEELKAELNKCNITYSNCHRLITAKILPIELIKNMYTSTQSEVQIQ